MMHYDRDPEEYIVTTITIAMPVGPNASSHIVTITYGSNSTAAETVTIYADTDQVQALDKAWAELWDTAMHDDAADRVATSLAAVRSNLRAVTE